MLSSCPVTNAYAPRLPRIETFQTIPLQNSVVPIMKIGNYYIDKTLGKGNFAVVKLATHCDTKQKVAIKIIDKSRLEPSDHQKLEREISVMKSFNHPNIIRLYQVMESKHLIYLVTEYAEQGEMLDYLIREKRLSECKAKEKFRQLVLAVEYIHSKNIVHRDLKAENLLLDSEGNLKVADFGFANSFQPNGKLQTFCGSPPYAAPELFQNQPYSPEKVDVWSLGVLLYIFVCGHLPFDSSNLAELRRQVLAGQINLPFYLSDDCRSLITHMLTVNPEQRYSIRQIKSHSWFMPDDQSQSIYLEPNPTMINCPLINAILDQAESYGYNRQQIVKSVQSQSYDSDAAIWHLLLDKFQKACRIEEFSSYLSSNESDTTSSDTNQRQANFFIETSDESHSLENDDSFSSQSVHIPPYRRASDSGPYPTSPPFPVLMTYSKTFASFTHTSSTNTKSSSRGSITRGVPIVQPTISISSPDTDEDDDQAILTRYLNYGKRHTVCEQGSISNGKMRRPSFKDRCPFSRRASDTSSSMWNSSYQSHLERLYNQTMIQSSTQLDEENLTTSSLQELHQLQKQIQKSERRSICVGNPSSPSQSLSLHSIREEQQSLPTDESSKSFVSAHSHLLTVPSTTKTNIAYSP